MALKNSIVTDLLRALLGGGSVGTFKRMRHAAVLWRSLLPVRTWTIGINCMYGDETQRYDECLYLFARQQPAGQWTA
jgi:hypothetical protein